MSNPSILPPRRDGFPGGPGPIGSARLLRRFFDDPVGWFCEVRERYGDLVGMRAGPVSIILCYDLELLEQVLVRDHREYRRGKGLKVIGFAIGNGLLVSDGDEHRRNRKLAAPVFTPRNIEVFAEPTVAITREMLESWPDDGVASIARDCYDVSLRVAGVGLFGRDFDEEERDGLHRAMADLNAGYELIVGPAGLFLAEHAPLRRSRQLRRGRDHVDAVVRALIAGRRRDGNAGELTDLLSRLIEARAADDSAFSDEQLRDEAVTMLLAGHDTTAATLGWCLSMLALHPHEQRLVHEELDAVIGDGDATAQDAGRLLRLRAVLDETLRLHPSAYSYARNPREPIRLATGHVLPPGTDVVVPVGGIHRDPRIWPDPLEFRPDRFADPEAVAARHRMSYVPFGAGPHVCIGRGFAIQEIVLVLATILQRYRIEPPDDWVLEAKVGFIRRPVGELPLRVVKRRA